MTPDLFSVDASGALDAARGGIAAEELEALVGRGRQVHDDLLLARARGQVGFADLYLLGREAMRAREAADALASRFENVAVLATGAEAEVAASLLSSLAHPFHNLLPSPGRAGRPRVILVDSADPDRLGAFLDSFPIEQTLVVTLSRDGTSLGSLLQFGTAREVARKRVGPGFQDHLVVVTDARSGTLREEALRSGLLAFDVPANVPARYSVLTPVGLLPAAVAGVDVRGVLAGAHTAAERAAGEDLRANPAYLWAAVLHLAAAVRARRTHLFVACTEALGPTAAHTARLFAESVGAAPAEPAARRTCEALVLPRDGARLAERAGHGADDLAVVFLEAQRASRDRAVPKDAPGLERLAGRSLWEVGAAEATAARALLREQRVPFVDVRLPALVPNAVGAFHMAAMLAAAFGGALAGGRPFAAPERGRHTELLDQAISPAS